MTDPNAIQNAITAARSTFSASSSSSSSTTAKKNPNEIGKDDFLKLLVGQLQHQDPMQPSDDTQFIGQMAQFSQLEQESNTATSTTSMADQLARTGALGLIGRNVSYTDADGATENGTVQQVNIGEGGKATLTVDGKGGIDAGAVTQVK
jgi:flagellar basal-body rod modification protein FlgD